MGQGASALSTSNCIIYVFVRVLYSASFWKLDIRVEKATSKNSDTQAEEESNRLIRLKVCISIYIIIVQKTVLDELKTAAKQCNAWTYIYYRSMV